LRAVEIRRFFFAGDKRAGSRALQVEIGGGFTRPIELITFARAGKVFCAEDEFELLKVDLVFAKDFGENFLSFNMLFCLKLFSKSCIISVRFGSVRFGSVAIVAPFDNV